MHDFLQNLPSFNAGMNGISIGLLSLGLLLIKRDKVRFKLAHRACMLGALGASSLFLVGYIAHKIFKRTSGQGLHTSFAGEGFWVFLYYPMLISHVVLAMVMLPLILFTLNHALKGRFEQHRRAARYAYPIWYYVSLTGIFIYILLYHSFKPSGL